jgi:UDP-glucose 4-epimerase
VTPQEHKTCLVTGALGFLGQRIVGEFAASGYRVVGLGREDVPAGLAVSLGLASYTTMDLPSSQLAEILAAEQPDVIVHAAGPASVADSMERPMADFHGTVGVLFALLDAIREHSPHSRVIILSSAAVYGNPVQLPIAEDAAIAPVSPYGFHKQIAETLLREFAEVYGVRTAAARIFSAYGSGLRRQIFWDVCEKAADGSVTLFGTGDEGRDFVHAADVAQAARIIAENAPMQGEAYNVASGIETTIRVLAEKTVSYCAPGVAVEFSGVARPGDPLRWRADISRIEALGFSPRITLDGGVAEYCAWYQGVREES